MDLQPLCAQPCIASAMLAVGCQVNELSCGCAPDKQDSIGSLAASCLLNNCPATQLLAIGNAGKAGCSAYSLTYMFTNDPTTMATATVSLMSPTLSSTTSTITSSGTVARNTGTRSTTSTPTNLPASATNAPLQSHSGFQLSTAATAAIVVGVVTVLSIFILVAFCCVRRRRSNFKRMQRRDSELFDLVSQHSGQQELDTKSIRHEMTARWSQSMDSSWIAPPPGIYELASETNTEESLLKEPHSLLGAQTPPPPTKTLAKKNERSSPQLPRISTKSLEISPPRIFVQLATPIGPVERSHTPEDPRKPNKLRKVEKANSLRGLRDLRLVKSMEEREARNAR